MMPASAMPFCSSAMSSMSFVSVRSWPSSVVNFSPSAARRTTMVGRAFGLSAPLCCDQMIIERVQRLADLQHHVVRHVHDVVDAADADLLQRVAQPVRAGANLHAVHHARRVARTQLRILEAHRHAIVDERVPDRRLRRTWGR